MAGDGSGFDSMLDILIAALAALLIYLAWKKKVLDLSPPQGRWFLHPKKRDARGFREKADDELQERKEERKSILGQVAESRKKYMKGGIGYGTYLELQRGYDSALVETDARITALSEISGKPAAKSARLRDLFAQDGE
ncbi:MAG: hypothetical protein V1708_04045 [Candidatus Micrarchaeota archaeon]